MSREDVRQDPYCQSRGNRAAGAAGLQGAGHCHGRRPLDGRRRRYACTFGGRKRLHWAAAGKGQLSQHSCFACRLWDHWRGCRASGLWFSFRECAFCRNFGRAQCAFHRASPRAHSTHGRQDRGQARRQGTWHSSRSGLRRRRRPGFRSRGSTSGARGRLSPNAQSRGGWWRPRHARGYRRDRVALGAGVGAGRGKIGFRRRHALSRKISEAAAPHRNPSSRRRQGRRYPSR